MTAPTVTAPPGGVLPDTAAVHVLLDRIARALHPGAPELRLPIDVPGRGAIVLRAEAVHASVRVQLGDVVALLPARQAIVAFSQLAALAIRAGTDALAPLPGTRGGA